MKFDDIIDLPHFHDPNFAKMPNSERAAQFAPYKSLVGYEDMIVDETKNILSGGDEIIDYSVFDETYED